MKFKKKHWIKFTPSPNKYERVTTQSAADFVLQPLAAAEEVEGAERR